MYGRFPYRALKGEVDFDAGALKAALAGVYDFDQAHDQLAHVTQSVGTGYAPVLVQNWSLEFEPASGRTVIFGDDPNFPHMTVDVVRGVVFYLEDGATNPLVAYHRFQVPRTIEDAPFTYFLHDRTVARILT
jgi:hypothetical protein